MAINEIVDKNIKSLIRGNIGAILWLGHGDKNFYVVKRKFTAKDMEDKEMRNALNEDIETSEYMVSQKYGVVDDLDNRKRKFSAGFRSKREAVLWIYNYFILSWGSFNEN